jgi:hypothetical protein
LHKFGALPPVLRKFEIEPTKYLINRNQNYFVSGVSKEKFGGTVRHSSPACRNLMTSPPKTQETFFTLDKPVPKGEIIQ